MNRIQKFTPDGGVSLPRSASRARRSGSSTDRPAWPWTGTGDIYVCDWLNDRVQVLGADGRFVDQFHGDSTLSKWFLELGAIPPEDQIIKRKFMSEDGYKEKFFSHPISVKLDHEGHLFVADSLRFRVQVYLKEAYPSKVLMEVDMDQEPITVG